MDRDHVDLVILQPAELFLSGLSGVVSVVVRACVVSELTGVTQEGSHATGGCGLSVWPGSGKSVPIVVRRDGIPVWVLVDPMLSEKPLARCVPPVPKPTQVVR